MTTTIYKEKDTGKIAAVFENCTTKSETWNDTNKYTIEKIEGQAEIHPDLKPPQTEQESLEDKIRRIAREEIGATP